MKTCSSHHITSFPSDVNFPKWDSTDASHLDRHTSARVQITYQYLFLFSGSYRRWWCRVWRGRGAGGRSTIIVLYMLSSLITVMSNNKPSFINKMCNISYKKSCYSPTKKYLNNLKFKYTSHNTILCRVGLMQSHTMQIHGVRAKAGCISHFVSKYILYLSSYFCICNVSSWVCTGKAPRFIFVLGPDMSQTGPDSKYKWLGMWKKETQIS